MMQGCGSEILYPQLRREFYEARYFRSGYGVADETIVLAGRGAASAATCSSRSTAWSSAWRYARICGRPCPLRRLWPCARAKVVFNLSASPEIVGKHDYLRSLIAQQSARTVAAYVYASSGRGESSTDLVFAGNAIIAENGRIMEEAGRFSREGMLAVADIDADLLSARRTTRNTFEYEAAPAVRVVEIETVDAEYRDDLRRTVDPMPFVPSDEATREERCAEIFEIQSRGLVQRLEHTRCKCAVIGISGGLDSTLALLVTVHAFDILGLDRKGIIGVTMPRLRYDRPHLRQCPEYDACAGREHRRGVDQGGVRAAFQGYRPAGERQVGNIRERSGARAHADTYGYCQHARRHGRRYGRYERAGAGLGDL